MEAKVTVWRAAKQTKCGREFTRSNQQQKLDEVTGKRTKVREATPWKSQLCTCWRGRCCPCSEAEVGSMCGDILFVL